jgi:hypothetical protein
VRIEFIITPRLHYKGIRELTRLMPSARWAYAFFLGVPALLVVVVLVMGLGVHRLLENWAGIIGGPVFIFVLLPLLAYWQVRSNHRTNAALKGPQIYEFTEEGLSARGPLHTATVSWTGFHKAVETRTFFFLFLSSQQAYFIPRDAVSAQVGLDPFRMLLRRHLGESVKLKTDPVRAAA